MDKKVLIYAGKVMAHMLFHDAKGHSNFAIGAFVHDASYINGQDTLMGLPLVSLDDVAALYPPSDYDMLVAMTSFDDMRSRSQRYETVKALGYQCRNYISESSIVTEDVVMGENNMVFAQSFLGAGGRLGNGNMIRQQVYIGHDFRIGDFNVFSPGVNVGGSSIMGNNCYIGIGATIINKITVGEESLVGAGSVVIRNTEAYSKNVGNPSKIIGYHPEGLRIKL